MDIFEFAMQMEKDGEDYYRHLVKQTENKGLKRIFIMLADDEVKHYETIKKMRTEAPRLAETQILSGAKNIFTQLKASGEKFNFDGKQAKLYKKAQEIEKKSQDFYLTKAKEVEKAYQREIFLKLAEEEKKHYFLLENIIEFVSRPETWVENAEFYHSEQY
jgi:predicted RND superfamily exporter protein